MSKFRMKQPWIRYSQGLPDIGSEIVLQDRNVCIELIDGNHLTLEAIWKVNRSDNKHPIPLAPQQFQIQNLKMSSPWEALVALKS